LPGVRQEIVDFAGHLGLRDEVSVISIFDGANAEVFEVPRPIR